MNLKEIKNVLTEIYNKELDYVKKRHIVFWYDEEGEFAEDINEINLDNVRVLKLTDNDCFALKYEIEKVDKSSHFLIYANMQKPSPRSNYLLDILKYSTEFSTDKTTVIMRELGVKEDALKGVFKKYLKFFNNKERFTAFKAYGLDSFTEEKIDTEVISTLCKLNICDNEDVINSALNYGYTIIRSVVARTLVMYGFNTALGVNHCNELNSFNFADDCAPRRRIQATKRVA